MRVDGSYQKLDPRLPAKATTIATSSAHKLLAVGEFARKLTEATLKAAATLDNINATTTELPPSTPRAEKNP